MLGAIECIGHRVSSILAGPPPLIVQLPVARSDETTLVYVPRQDVGKNCSDLSPMTQDGNNCVGFRTRRGSQIDTVVCSELVGTDAPRRASSVCKWHYMIAASAG